MTDAELRCTLELMREFRVSHLKRADLELTIELAPLESSQALDAIGAAAQIDPEEAKYWSVNLPQPEEEAKKQ